MSALETSTKEERQSPRTPYRGKVLLYVEDGRVSCGARCTDISLEGARLQTAYEHLDLGQKVTLDFIGGDGFPSFTGTYEVVTSQWSQARENNLVGLRRLSYSRLSENRLREYLAQEQS